MKTYCVRFTRTQAEPLDARNWHPYDAAKPSDAVGVALAAMGPNARPWMQGGDFWAHVAKGDHIDMPRLVHLFKLHPTPKEI